MEKEKELKVSKCLAFISIAIDAVAVISFFIMAELGNILGGMLAPMIFGIMALVTGIISSVYKNKNKVLAIASICLSVLVVVASFAFTLLMLFAAVEN